MSTSETFKDWEKAGLPYLSEFQLPQYLPRNCYKITDDPFFPCSINYEFAVLTGRADSFSFSQSAEERNFPAAEYERHIIAVADHPNWNTALAHLTYLYNKARGSTQIPFGLLPHKRDWARSLNV